MADRSPEDMEDALRSLIASCSAHKLLLELLVAWMMKDLPRPLREDAANSIRQAVRSFDVTGLAVGNEVAAEYFSDTLVRMHERIDEILAGALARIPGA